MMESQFLETSPDTVIHFRITKTPSTSDQQMKSPLVVFLHYWGGSSATWHKLTSSESPLSLSTRYPSVSIDLRGWGQSTEPVHGATAGDYSITPMASDVVSVLNHLKTGLTTTTRFENGIVLVGHSMGAKVALAALCSLPDDMLVLIKGLVLVAPAPPTPLALPLEMSEQQRRAYDTEESVRWTVQNVLSNQERLTDEDLSMIVRDTLAGNTLAKDGWILHGMQEDISPAVDELSSRPNATGIKISVLAGELDMVEQKDRVEHEVVQALTARGFPVTFTVLKDVKHLIPVEDPEAISRAISTLLAD